LTIDKGVKLLVFFKVAAYPLTEVQYAKLRVRLLKSQGDNIRFCFFCQRGQGKAERIGGPPVEDKKVARCAGR